MSKPIKMGPIKLVVGLVVAFILNGLFAITALNHLFQTGLEYDLRNFIAVNLLVLVFGSVNANK